MSGRSVKILFFRLTWLFQFFYFLFCFLCFLLIQEFLLFAGSAIFGNTILFREIHAMFEFPAMEFPWEVFRMVHNVILAGDLFLQLTVRIRIKIILPGLFPCCRTIKD